jgi:hypothetical protein
MQELGDFPTGRFEHKYLVPDRVAVAIREALRPHVNLDSHMPPDSVRGYAVYSLYFDSPHLDLYQNTRNRVPNRIKLRVRFYDNAADGVAFVEIKERAQNQIFKRRYQTSKSFVEAMLRDASCESLVQALGNGSRGTALEEFCNRRRDLAATPKVFIAYEREAYNSKAEPKVRITFDRRIKTNPCAGSAGLSVPRYGSNVGGVNVLLEFKYTGEPPAWLTGILTEFRLRRASFSKFAECIDVLGISGNQPRRHKLGVKKSKT